MKKDVPRKRNIVKRSAKGCFRNKVEKEEKSACDKLLWHYSCSIETALTTGVALLGVKVAGL